MRSRLILILLAAVIPLSARGTWELGGKVSVVQGSGSPRLQAVVTAEYRLMEYLSWRTDMEALFSDLSRSSTFDLTIPSNLLWYPLGHSYKIEPYTGPGLSYTYTSGANSYFGCNYLAGVRFRPEKRSTFGIECKYAVRDITRWSDSQSIAFGLTGSWEFAF
jgi:hypothetical protein